MSHISYGIKVVDNATAAINRLNATLSALHKRLARLGLVTISLRGQGLDGRRERRGWRKRARSSRSNPSC